jgi:hypothetical protein
MDRVWRPTLFLAIALTLSSGCAGSFVTPQGQAHHDGMPNAFDTAAARGEMPPVMTGDPFPCSKEALERAVASALGRHPLPWPAYPLRHPDDDRLTDALQSRPHVRSAPGASSSGALRRYRRVTGARVR